MITENLSTLKIHKLTQEQYDNAVAAGNIDASALYLTPDEDLSKFETKVDATSKLDEAKTYTDEQIVAIPYAGKKRILSGYSASATLSVINSSATTFLLTKPIELNYDNPFEFELEVFGITGSGNTGTLQLKNSKGTVLGTLFVRGSNFGAFRKSKCHISLANNTYVYSYEGEDYISSIQNSIPWNIINAGTFSLSTSADKIITQYTWTPSGTLKCNGFCLTYQELRGLSSI